ncbi:MAG TPA: hypothetical protein VM008_02725 [Phycisphaerae bacterium]|nr:hypothetical protein [Phycisphaerae bacterium]
MQRHRTIAAILLLTSAVVRAESPATAPAQIDEAYTKAARNLERAARERDLDALKKIIDMHALEQLVMQGVTAQKQTIHDHYTEWANCAPLATRIVSERRNGYSYDLVNVTIQDGKTRALYRLVSSTGGFWYVAWVLAKDDNGVVKAVDSWPSNIGDYRSNTLRKFYTKQAADSDARDTAALMGDTDAESGTSQEGNRMIAAYDSRKMEEALSIYQSLPESVQHEKEYSIYRVYAASYLRNSDPDGYREAIDDYQRLFANDPSVDAICFDGWLFEKDYASCYAALDRMEKLTGGDPFLDAVRAKVTLLEAGADAPKNAERLARQAVAGVPRSVFAQLMLMRILVLQRRFDEAIDPLAAVEKIEGHPVPLERMPSMTEFVDSDSYQQYRRQHVAVTQPAP